MARVGLVESFERRADAEGNVSEVKVDLGGGNIVTADYYAPPGDDPHPLPGDFALVVETDAEGTGVFTCLGFMDPKIAGEAGPGERMVYSRSAPGAIAAKLLLKADGSVDINDGAAVLRADGVLEVAGDVIGAGISLSTHMHAAGLLLDSLSAPVTGTTSTPS